MVRRFGLVVMLCMALAFTVTASAQDSEKKASPEMVRVEKGASSFYKLDLTVKEMDGAKALNSRTYNIAQAVDEWGQLRVGSRMPISTNPGSSQWQYFDVGLNMDSKLRERDGVVSLDWRLELSSVPSENPGAPAPVVRNLKNNGQTILAVGKPTLLTSVDDLSSSHKFIFEVTATKVK